MCIVWHYFRYFTVFFSLFLSLPLLFFLSFFILFLLHFFLSWISFPQHLWFFIFYLFLFLFFLGAIPSPEIRYDMYHRIRYGKAWSGENDVFFQIFVAVKPWKLIWIFHFSSNISCFLNLFSLELKNLFLNF